MSGHDVIVVGGGVMGCSTALWLARGGMRTVLVERGELCRGASGVNAGTLTLQMTRSALIPYAMEGWRLWTSAREWLGHDVGVVPTDGLCLAFTAAEAELLTQRSDIRRQAGAPIELLDPACARAIEPGLSDRLLLAAHCPIDGHASAYLTGLAFRQALLTAGCEVVERAPVSGIEREGSGFRVLTAAGARSAARIVLAGGVWLEPMLDWLGLKLAVSTLINQLVVTERMPVVMRSVVTIASGLLSLKQFANGTVLIGGGWQGRGDRQTGETAILPESLLGNVRLATWAIPALRRGRILRSWLGFEAETADAMPMIGPVLGVENAYVIGSVHSGYTSGPFMGRLLAEHILDQEPSMPLFPIDRLILPTTEGAFA